MLTLMAYQGNFQSIINNLVDLILQPTITDAKLTPTHLIFSNLGNDHLLNLLPGLISHQHLSERQARVHLLNITIEVEIRVVEIMVVAIKDFASQTIVATDVSKAKPLHFEFEVPNPVHLCSLKIQLFGNFFPNGFKLFPLFIRLVVFKLRVVVLKFFH